MADYNANIRVSADTKKAESDISKLQERLTKLSDFTLKLNSRDIGRQVSQLGQQLQGIGERGLLGGLTLAAGKTTTALGALGAKLGVVGAAAAAAGSTINSALGGVPGVIGDILAQIGQVPNAMGIAAVAAMAFAPQLTKAAASAVGLGAAIDKAVGTQTTGKIASVIGNISALNTEIKAAKSSFESLIEGSTLNQLNEQLRDAVKQSGAFHSSTEDAVTAAEQLVAVQREQAKEQQAINDLIRQAQGLQPQDVRDTEVARRASALKTRELQQRRDAELQAQINTELADYERIAAEVAAQTKQWADNLDRVARSSRSGVLGSSSQIQARLEEMRQNRNSADIARQRSAEILALEARQRGANYSLAQVPAGGELFPGGNSLTASSQYRGMLNAQAQMRQAAASALAQSERTVLGFQAQTLRTEKDITASKLQQQEIDQRSIQIARERNKLLLEEYQAEKRVAAGTLDRASRVAELRRRKAQGKELGKQAESLALGVGFPLLFGGGPGSVGGAAIGSFVGTGFGGQILGGAIGQAIDQFGQAAAQTGNALRAPIENFKQLADAGLLASKGQEKYIQKLIEAGKTAEASALIQSQITNKIGVQGMKDLQNAGAASEKLNKAMAELNLQMQAAVAGPLAGFLSWMAKLVNVANTRNSIEAQQAEIYKNLNPNDRKSFARAVDRTKSGATLFSSDLGQREAELQRIFDTYRAKLPQRPASAPGSTVESQQARATTQELQKQVELNRAQLGLAGLTLEKDGARYVTAVKNVALQERNNKLLEIQASWIGHVFDKEQNLAMIRSANLEYQAKIRAIDSQVAERAQAQEQALLQAGKARLQVESEKTAIVIRRVELEQGIAAGLAKEIALSDATRAIKMQELALDERLALKEAEKNGLVKQTQDLYIVKRATLENQLYLEQLIRAEKQSQLDIEKEIQSQQRSNQFAQTMGSLEMPGFKTPMEQLLIQQSRTRDSLLAPLLSELNAAQTTLFNAGPGTSDQAITETQARIAELNSQIEELSSGLAKVEAGQIAWEKNRTGVEALNNVLNGVGTTFTNVFSELITGTDNWANSLTNVFNIFANLLLQAGLNTLAGGDGRGFFSILNGTFGRKAAKGAYFSNGVAAFGMGGTFANSIVRTPTLFKYAKGGALATGVMGEAGPEAVMPLTRGPNGELGVSTYGGGGSVNSVVNITINDSGVKSDKGQASELGRMIDASVMSIIQRERRTGGVLAR